MHQAAAGAEKCRSSGYCVYGKQREKGKSLQWLSEKGRKSEEIPEDLSHYCNNIYFSTQDRKSGCSFWHGGDGWSQSGKYCSFSCPDPTGRKPYACRGSAAAQSGDPAEPDWKPEAPEDVSYYRWIWLYQKFYFEAELV